MKEDLKKWLSRFEARSTSVEDATKLNELLGSPSQVRVREIVQKLPDDTASMQWRSALNEKLFSLAPVKRKLTAWALGLRAAAGISVACLVVFAFTLRHERQPAEKAPADFAAALISEHRQSVALSEIAGPGMVDGEAEKSNDSDFNSGSDTDVNSI